MINLYLKIVITGKTYECCVSADTSFFELIPVLNEMICEDLQNEYILTPDAFIYESGRMQLCDKDVSLQSLNVTDNMTFLIF